MYTNFYSFDKEPFHVTPDPDFLFLSPSHKEALASIIYGIEKRKGFIVITGEVGVGKTTILRYYLEKIKSQKRKIIYIFNPGISFHDLITTIYRELGIEARNESLFDRVHRLHEAMIEEFKVGFNIVLVIDEAQNMPVETLENLRMLSNLETSTDKLIQIVMVGQPEFEDMLNKNILRQLKQRVAVYSKILPLTPRESGEYIRHRLKTAGGEGEYPYPFTKGALKKIIAESRGIPRLINILSDNSLIAGFGYQKKPVHAKIVSEVIADFKGERKPRSGWRFVLAAMFLLLSLAFLVNNIIKDEALFIYDHGYRYLAHAKATLGSMAESFNPPGTLANSSSERDKIPPKNAQAEPQEIYRGDINRDYEEGFENESNARGPDLLDENALSQKTTGGSRYFNEKLTASEQERMKSGFSDSDSGRTAGMPNALEAQRLPESSPVMTAQGPKTAVPSENEILEVSKTPKTDAIDNNHSQTTTPVSVLVKMQEQMTPPPMQKNQAARKRPGSYIKPSPFTPIQKDRFPVTRIVQEGDYLFKLAEEIYGIANMEILEWVRITNPGIKDLDLIFAGDTIVFPYIEISVKEKKHDQNL